MKGSIVLMKLVATDLPLSALVVEFKFKLVHAVWLSVVPALQEAIVELFLEQVLLNVGFLRLRIMIGRSRRSSCSASICTARYQIFNLNVLIFLLYILTFFFVYYPFKLRLCLSGSSSYELIYHYFQIQFTLLFLLPF